MSGIAWLTAAGSVFFRDIPNLVAVSLNVLFYLTPVFYGLHTVPEKYAPVLEANPMATIVNSYRAILIGEPYPSTRSIVYTLVLSVILAVVGYMAFTRVQSRFVDSL
jgi:lipopolysaccharide transport system permease protein